MNERLLQFIWQFQYFNNMELQTTDHEHVTVIQPGKLNTNQGPDFLEAKVRIGNNIWVGNLELHIYTSDWIKHRHDRDKNYANVILHVVWRDDMVVKVANGSPLPTIELHNRVPKLLLDRYESLMKQDLFIPCSPFLPVLDDMKWIAWKERIAVERLQRKSADILILLKVANNHWEELFWWKLAANFGIKVNAEIFQTIAQSISINILAKHKNQLHQLEALLLGQANLLNGDYDEDYPQMLQKEYNFLKKKYKLQHLQLQPHFLRMRPANFPTIRLAQLAMLVNHSSHLFSNIKELESINEIMDLFAVTANDYWHYHYQFDEQVDFHPKPLGKEMIGNIIINTIVPILFANGLHLKDEMLKMKALRWLSELAPEKNTITNKWTVYKVSNKNALESQALIELKNNYCNERRCLQCAVGNVVMREVK